MSENKEVVTTNTEDNLTNTESKNSSDSLTNNDLLRIINIIEVMQRRGKIKASDMYRIGAKYLRLASYLEFTQLDEEKKKEALEKEEDENGAKYLKKLELTDLVFYFNFIDANLKADNFNGDEIYLVEKVGQKVFATLKPFIKKDEQKHSDESFNPLETIKEE